MTSDLARFCDFVKSGFGCTDWDDWDSCYICMMFFFLCVFVLEEFGIILHVNLRRCMKNRRLRRADGGQIFQQPQTA